ncbi:MAG: (2Fe-2S)-binding protein [Prolixibacteraceae bacterium]|nr:(2Fe-2S)-binding protein [Prolixibacteraceae bacterium]
MGKRLVCLCNMVSENEILAALKKGARSTPEIQKMTAAGTSCGRCLVVIDSIVEEFLAQQPIDPQQRFDFGS